MAEEVSKTVFVSHAASEHELAARLAAYLEKNGLKTWYAERNKPQLSFRTSIASVIEECGVFVVLLSKAADLSRDVLCEVDIAWRHKKPILCVRVEDVEPRHLEYFLSSHQWFDWLDHRDEILAKLVEGIKTIRG